MCVQRPSKRRPRQSSKDKTLLVVFYKQGEDLQLPTNGHPMLILLLNGNKALYHSVSYWGANNTLSRTMKKILLLLIQPIDWCPHSVLKRQPCVLLLFRVFLKVIFTKLCYKKKLGTGSCVIYGAPYKAPDKIFCVPSVTPSFCSPTYPPPSSANLKSSPVWRSETMASQKKSDCLVILQRSPVFNRNSFHHSRGKAFILCFSISPLFITSTFTCPPPCGQCFIRAKNTGS